MKQTKNKNIPNQQQNSLAVAQQEAVVKEAIKSKSTKGLLKDIVKSVLKESGGVAGSILGDRLGMSSQGRQVGRALGARLSKLVGSGDYTLGDDMSYNSLFKGGNIGKPDPHFGDSESAYPTQGREYLMDVTTGPSGSFTVTTVAMNPALEYVFSKLCHLAQSHEEYVFKGLAVEYRPVASNYSTTTTLPEVALNAIYNVLSPSYSSKSEFMDSGAPVSARCDKGMLFGFECAPNSNVNDRYYTRTSNNSVLPLNETDFANLQVGVQSVSGLAAGTLLGSLYVTYDIVLARPRVPRWLITQLHLYNSTKLIAATADFQYAYYNGAFNVATATGGVFTIPSLQVGDVLEISVWVQGTAITGLSVAGVSGCTNTNLYGNHGTAFFGSANAAGTQYLLNTGLVVTAQAATFSISATATTVTSSDIVIRRTTQQSTF